MTKLFQWLLGLSLYVGVWLGLLANRVNNPFIEEWSEVIKFSPIIVLGLFIVYSLSVVLWRVFTFNDCPEAAKELQEQIQQTKEELRRKGIIF